MAEFKPRLQQSNIDLTEVLNQINALPPAGTEDVSAELTAQTEEIAALKALAQQKVAENNGEGEYVWGKYENFPDLTMTVLSSSDGATIIQVVSDDIDLSSVDSSFFIGYKCNNLPSGGTSHVVTFTSSVDVHILWAGTNNLNTTFAYDPTTARITIQNSWSGTPTDTFKKIDKECLGYVVSDDSTTYPDGGSQDGYWYESVDGGMPIPYGLSIQNITYLTPTAYINSTAGWNHNAGVTPKMLLFFATSDVGNSPSSSKYHVMRGMAMLDTDSASTGHLMVHIKRTDGSISSRNTALTTMSASTMKTNSSLYLYWNLVPNVEYCFVALA